MPADAGERDMWLAVARPALCMLYSIVAASMRVYLNPFPTLPDVGTVGILLDCGAPPNIKTPFRPVTPADNVRRAAGGAGSSPD